MPRLKLVAPAERTCRVCGDTKEAALFAKQKHNICKKCHADYVRERSRGNERIAAQRRARYRVRKEADPIHRTLIDLKQRAKKTGVPFDLVRADVFVPTHCPLLGIPLVFRKQGDPWRNDHYPEIDRLVPELGYVRGNVTIISARANRIKNDGTAEEHERIAAWMRSRGAK